MTTLSGVFSALRSLPAALKRGPEASSARTAARQAHLGGRSPIPAIDYSQLAELLGRAAENPTICLPSAGILPVRHYVLGVIAALVSPTKVVEFGTSMGWSTLVLAMNALSADILTIDLPDSASVEDTRSLGAIDHEVFQKSRGRLGEAFIDSPYAGRIQQVLVNSTQFSLSSYVDRADLIFIDGGHSYECISADTENVEAVACSGTAIVWDDYTYFFPDVVRFLDERARNHRLFRILETPFVMEICP